MPTFTPIPAQNLLAEPLGQANANAQTALTTANSKLPIEQTDVGIEEIISGLAEFATGFIENLSADTFLRSGVHNVVAVANTRPETPRPRELYVVGSSWGNEQQILVGDIVDAHTPFAGALAMFIERGVNAGEWQYFNPKIGTLINDLATGTRLSFMQAGPTGWLVVGRELNVEAFGLTGTGTVKELSAPLRRAILAAEMIVVGQEVTNQVIKGAHIKVPMGTYSFNDKIVRTYGANDPIRLQIDLQGSTILLDDFEGFLSFSFANFDSRIDICNGKILYRVNGTGTILNINYTGAAPFSDKATTGAVIKDFEIDSLDTNSFDWAGEFVDLTGIINPMQSDVTYPGAPTSGEIDPAILDSKFDTSIAVPELRRREIRTIPMIPKEESWITAVGRGINVESWQIVNESAVNYANIEVNGEPCVEWTSTAPGGLPIGNPKMYDARQSSGKIYRITIDAEHLSGTAGRISALIYVFDRFGAEQAFQFRESAATINATRSKFTTYVCTNPTDAVAHDSITPVALNGSDENTMGFMAFAAVRSASRQRLFLLEVEDVTMEVKGAWTWLPGDQSARVSADPRGIVYRSLAHDPTGSTGCFERDGTWKTTGIPAQWSGVEISVSDNAPRINDCLRVAQFAASPRVILPASTQAAPLMVGRTETNSESGTQHLSIRLRDGVILASERETWLKLINASDCHVIYGFNASNTGTRNIFVDGNRANQTDQGDNFGGNDPVGIIMIGTTTNCSFIGGGAINTLDYGIGLQGTQIATNIRIQEMNFSNNGSDCFDAKGSAVAVNCRIENCSFDMLSPVPGASSQAAINTRPGWAIVGNEIRNLTGDTVGIRAQEGVDGSGVEGGCTVSGNQIFSSAGDSTIGVSIRGKESILSANIINGTNIGVAVRSRSCVLSANIIDGTALPIDIGSDTADAANDTVLDNNIIRSNPVRVSPAIAIESATQNTTISGGTIRNYTQGIDDSGSGTTWSNIAGLRPDITVSNIPSLVFESSVPGATYALEVHHNGGLNYVSARIRINGEGQAVIVSQDSGLTNFVLSTQAAQILIAHVASNEAATFTSSVSITKNL